MFDKELLKPPSINESANRQSMLSHRMKRSSGQGMFLTSVSKAENTTNVSDEKSNAFGTP
jgi:hypothetical protein